MLTIPKDWIAAQECVGGNAKGPGLATARPSGKVEIAANVEVHVLKSYSGQQLKNTMHLLFNLFQYHTHLYVFVRF